MPIDPFARKMIFSTLAFGGVLLFIMATLALVYFHSRPRCQETLLAEAVSPDRHWVAAVSERRCGETSEWLAHVNLRRAGESIRVGYFSGRATQGEVFGLELESQDQIPNVAWMSADELMIRCARCSPAALKKKEGRWESVRVLYQMGQP